MLHHTPSMSLPLSNSTAGHYLREVASGATDREACGCVVEPEAVQLQEAKEEDTKVVIAKC